MSSDETADARMSEQLEGPQARKKRRSGVLVGAVIGLGIAVVAVAALSFSGALQWANDGGEADVDTSAVQMPASVGELKPMVQAAEASGASGETLKSLAERQKRTTDLTTQAYAEAYGGAGAGAELYTDDGLDLHVTVIAVRGPSPALTLGAVQDPAVLGLAAPAREIVSVGDLTCLVTRLVVRAGETPDLEDSRTEMCQRSEAGMTVVSYASGMSGPGGQDTLVNVTNEAYEAVAGE